MVFAKVLFPYVWVFLRLIFQMYWFYKWINFFINLSGSIIAESFNVRAMKKKKNEEEQNSENTKVLSESHHNETDEAILENIIMRQEENQALKKLLDNLNLTLPKSKA
jgi:ABC-type uncharacterized transport system fused permease/ATPase subunit